MENKRDWAYYNKQLETAHNKEKSYRKECEEIEKEYVEDKQFNILFSNADLLLSAIACNNPKPVIRVRFPKQQAGSDYERNTARIVGEIVERAVLYNNEFLDLKEKIKEIAQSAILSGRGAAWVSYEPVIERREETREVRLEDGSITYEDAQIEELGEQKVNLESVSYQDFRCTPAKKWEQVWWVARRHLLDKAEL